MSEKSNCCGAGFKAPGWPDSDICSKCGEHASMQKREESAIRSFLRSLVESPMAVYAPTKSQAKLILNAIRAELGIDRVDPTWREYVTVRSGSSNKFHYFAVFRRGSEFLAVNAHGRIGYPSIQVTEIGAFPDAEEAIDACEIKCNYKMRTRGYQVDKLM